MTPARVAGFLSGGLHVAPRSLPPPLPPPADPAVIDPHAQRRPDAPRRDWLLFRKRMILGAALVAAAVLASALTEPVVSLLDQDLSGESVGVGLGFTVFNLVMFPVAYALPPLLVAAGVALPLVGLYQYREAMLHPRRRGQATPGALPVGRATALGAAEVVLLLVLAAVGIVALNPREQTGEGLAEPTVVYEEPPWTPPE